MAKKNRSKSSSQLSRRNVRNIASNRLLLRRSLNLRSIQTLNSILAAQQRRNLYLSEIQDARRHIRRPQFRRALTVYGSPARIKNNFPSTRLSPAVFQSVDRSALVCVRRKSRREVMFAKKYAGRGGQQRRHRRNANSKLICR